MWSVGSLSGDRTQQGSLATGGLWHALAERDGQLGLSLDLASALSQLQSLVPCSFPLLCCDEPQNNFSQKECRTRGTRAANLLVVFLVRKK